MLIHECQYTHNQLLFIYINKYIDKIPNFISFSCDSYILSTVHNYWTSHVVKTKCYLPKFYYPWLLEPTSATFFSPVGSTSTGITATSTNLPHTSGNITSDNFNKVQTLGIVDVGQYPIAPTHMHRSIPPIYAPGWATLSIYSYHGL